MRSSVKRKFAFAGKSLLWSLSLYAVLMLALNWDDVRQAGSSNSFVSLADHTHPSSVGEKAGLLQGAWLIAKAIYGAVSVVTR